MTRLSRFGGVVFLVVGVWIAPLTETAAQEKTSGRLEVTIQRRTQTTDEELRKQLLSVPETGLDQPGADILYAPIVKAGAQVKSLPPDHGPTTFKRMANQIKRPDMTFLPWISGTDTELGKERAEDLHALSTKLRTALRASVKRDDIRPDPEKLRKLLADSEWTKPHAIPALTQMMQAENTAVRLLLIEMLARIRGKEASAALAQRAVFDLSPEVREQAVQALADRPVAEFTPVLQSALRYPWAPAADHSAEAVVALQLTGLVPELVKLLREPDPGHGFKTDKGHSLQEVVRINHLCNCMVCHAPSLSKDDLVRGRVPMPGEDPPPLYYQERNGHFVRADITYLRQDFSVVQPVANPGKWAGHQRYDYLVRTRPLNRTELTALQKREKEDKVQKTYPQQEAVLHALRQLTRKDFGHTYEAWATGLQNVSITQPTQLPVAPPPRLANPHRLEPQPVQPPKQR